MPSLVQHSATCPRRISDPLPLCTLSTVSHQEADRYRAVSPTTDWVSIMIDGAFMQGRAVSVACREHRATVLCC